MTAVNARQNVKEARVELVKIIEAGVGRRDASIF